MNPLRLALSCLGIAQLLIPSARADLPVQWLTQFAPGSPMAAKGASISSQDTTWISSSIGLYSVNGKGVITLTDPSAHGSSIGMLEGGALFTANGASVQRYTNQGAFMGTSTFPTIASPTLSGVTGYAANAFVIGEATGTPEPNSFLLKTSSTGAPIWQANFGSTGLNAATAVTIGSLGTTFVAGWTRGALSKQLNHGNADPYVIKFDANGFIPWQIQLGGVNNEYAFDLVADTIGNIYLTGRISYTDPNTIGRNTSDAFLTKLNANGTPLWTTIFDRSGADQSSAITLDKAGNIWIGGSSEQIVGNGIPSGITNPFLAEYSPGGALLGTQIFDTTHGGIIDDLQASPFGGVIAVGYTQGLTTQYSSGFGDPFVTRLIPEPSSCALLIGACGGLGMRRMRRRRG